MLLSLKIQSSMIDDLNNETHFPDKLLLIDRNVLKLRKAFANNSSKIVNAGTFLGRILGQLLRIGLRFMKNLRKPL